MFFIVDLPLSFGFFHKLKHDMLISELCIVTHFEMLIMNLSQSEQGSLCRKLSLLLETNYRV